MESVFELSAIARVLTAVLTFLMYTVLTLLYWPNEQWTGNAIAIVLGNVKIAAIR